MSKDKEPTKGVELFAYFLAVFLISILWHLGEEATLYAIETIWPITFDVEELCDQKD